MQLRVAAMAVTAAAVALLPRLRLIQRLQAALAAAAVMAVALILTPIWVTEATAGPEAAVALPVITKTRQSLHLAALAVQAAQAAALTQQMQAMVARAALAAQQQHRRVIAALAAAEVVMAAAAAAVSLLVALVEMAVQAAPVAQLLARVLRTGRPRRLVVQAVPVGSEGFHKAARLGEVASAARAALRVLLSRVALPLLAVTAALAVR